MEAVTWVTAQSPIAWRLPETAVRFGRPVHSRRLDDSSCGATLAAPSCKRCVNVNPDRASGSLPGRCERLPERHPYCIFGSASALNLVV